MKNLVEKVKDLFIEEEEVCGSIIINDMEDYRLLKEILENDLHHYETDVYKERYDCIIVSMIISENKYEELKNILKDYGRGLQKMSRIGLNSKIVKLSDY